MKEIDIKTISCGCYHSLILIMTGELFVCVRNSNGEIGRPKEIKR